MTQNFLNVQLEQKSPKYFSTRSVNLTRTIHRGESYQHTDQLNYLKQKAHKSFMQVMQMEALHQQQMEILRKQREQQQLKLKNKQQVLLHKIKYLQNQLGKLPNISFDNIDDISFREEVNYIDQSSIMNLREMLTQRQSNDFINDFKKQIKREIRLLAEGLSINQNHILDKIFATFQSINNQNIYLKEQNQCLNKKITKLQSQYKTLKIQSQSTFNQVKFLEDLIKRINNDKIYLEKKLSDFQKNQKNQENIIKLIKKNYDNEETQNYLKVTVQKHYNKFRKSSTTETESSLENQPNLIGGSSIHTLQRMSSDKGFPSKITQPGNALSALKNFRKKQIVLRSDK